MMIRCINWIKLLGYVGPYNLPITHDYKVYTLRKKQTWLAGKSTKFSWMPFPTSISFGDFPAKHVTCYPLVI